MGLGPCTEKVVNGHNSPTLLKTNYLELLAVKCFLLFLHRCHVLMSCDSSTTIPDSSQVHSHSRNHYSLDLTQRTPAVSLFGGQESCGTAMEDSVYLICRCYRNLFSPECERQSSNTSYCVTYLLFTMEQSTYYVMKLGHV